MEKSRKILPGKMLPYVRRLQLEEYLEEGRLADQTIIRMIAERKVFPCYFGSALKVQGVQEFLDGLEKYTGEGFLKWNAVEEGDKFGAKVYKISRDGQGSRLTYMKIVSGTLKVKDILSGRGKDGEAWEEKVNQIRVYSGEKYELVQEAHKGMVCAATGLNATYPGEGLGIVCASEEPVLEPVLNYQVRLPEGCDIHNMLQNLRQLEEEDPMLRTTWNEELGEIHVQLMGEVQTEILPGHHQRAVRRGSDFWYGEHCIQGNNRNNSRRSGAF